MPKLNKKELRYIRQLMAQGLDDDEIQNAIDDARADEAEERERYGDEYEDTRTSAEKEMCDRLDMGRNEAGEWLGFM